MPPLLTRYKFSSSARRAWVVLVACCLGMAGAHAALPGLTAAEPVTRYFNAKFPTSQAGIMPATLSATTLFTDLVALTPTSGLMPYKLNCPPWADGALMRRWIAIPNDGVVNLSTEKITNSTAGDWVFPVGTVIVKHFDLPINDLLPTLTKKVETQVLVLGLSGSWYGLTYRWRDDETDADVQTSALAVDRSFTIPTGATTTRTQTWRYVPRNQCLSCHTTTVGTVLGIRTPQLNGSQFYAKTGRTANQLWTLSSLGFFVTSLTESAITALPKTVAADDFKQTLETRARSYLEANCAHCHRTGISNFDLRFSTALGFQAILNAPTVADYGIPGQGLIRPRSPSTSIIYTRTNVLTGNPMPPTGKLRSDTAGQLTLAEWINSLQGYEQQGPSGLTGRYFNGTNFTSLRLTRADPNVSFDWGTSSPGAGVNADLFSVIWTGKILAPGTGTFTFTTDSDDGVKLFVNNQQIITGTTITTPPRSLRNGSVSMNAGQLYNFQLEYFESTGDAVCNLSWSGPAASGIVPAGNFFQSSTTALPGPPQAVNDTATVLRGSSVTIPVTTNDTDSEGDLAPTTVSIYTQPSKGSAVKNANGSITFTSNYAAGGGADMLLYRVNDATGATSNRAAVFLTIETDYGNWRALNFTAVELNNEPLSGWDADADGDGQSNLLEYATNTNPRLASSRSTPIQTRPSANVLQLRYAKRATADITYSVESSANGISWLSPDLSLTVSTTTNEVVVQVPLNAGKKFVRLRCDLIP